MYIKSNNYTRFSINIFVAIIIGYELPKSTLTPFVVMKPQCVVKTKQNAPQDVLPPGGWTTIELTRQWVHVKG
jgi:hypothetical protein